MLPDWEHYGCGLSCNVHLLVLEPSEYSFCLLRFVKQKWLRVTEALLVAALSACAAFVMIYFYNDCKTEGSIGINISSPLQVNAHKTTGSITGGPVKDYDSSTLKWQHYSHRTLKLQKNHTVSSTLILLTLALCILHLVISIHLAAIGADFRWIPLSPTYT